MTRGPLLVDDPGWGQESYPTLVRQSDGKRFVGFGLALLSTLLLPVTGQVGNSAWVWQIWPAVEWGERAGLAAPVLLGLALMGIGRWDALPRFWTGLLGLWALLVCGSLFAHSDLQSHRMFDGFTGFVGRNPLLVFVGLALIAAGAEWTMRAELRRVGRIALAAGAIALLAFSLWPSPGGTLVSQVVGHAGKLVALGRWRLFAGNLVFWMLALVPALLGVIGLWSALRTAPSPWGLPHAARYLVPSLVLMMTYPAAMVGLTVDAAMLQIRASLLILVVVNVGARSLEMVVRDLMEDSLPIGPPSSDWVRDTVLRQALAWLRGQPEETSGQVVDAPVVRQQWAGTRWLVRRRLGELGREFGVLTPEKPSMEQIDTFMEKLGPEPAKAVWTSRVALWLTQRVWRMGASGAVALASVVILAAAPWQAPISSLQWTLRQRTATADRLFGTVLPTYVASLAMRDQAQMEKTGSAEVSVELRQQGQELKVLAGDLDLELADRLGKLVRISVLSSPNGLGWIRAVAGINQRIRELGLPYYLYANAVEFERDRRERRLLYVNSYAVEELRWFADGDKSLASMLARRLDVLGFMGDGLGRMVREDPVATLLLDSIEENSAEAAQALRTGSCEPVAYAASAGLLEQAVWNLVGQACGELLSLMVGEAGEDGSLDLQSRSAILAVTERHELQHQADPEFVGIPVDVLVAHPSRSDAFLGVVSRELSAYSCELVTDVGLEQAASLLDLFRTAMTEPFAGTPEYIVAALLLGELASVQVLDERGVAGARALEQVAHDVWQGDEATTVATIRSRVQQAHLRWFGTPCATPQLVRTESTTPSASPEPAEHGLPL